MWSAQAKASVAPMVLRAVARSRPVRRAFPCLVESCQAPGAVLCEGIAEAVAKNHGGSKTFRGCYQFPSTGGSFASSACTREMSSSVPPAVDFHGGQDGPTQMRWPLPEHQRSQLDEEVQEMMELDIFKERNRLPGAVHESFRALDSESAGRWLAQDGHLTIPASSLHALPVQQLRELLMRVGEDSRGSQPELADRLLELLAELQEVLNEGPEKPNWSLDDDLRDEQRDFARVFAPEEVAELLVKARTEDVAIVDLRNVDAMRFTDYFVLATARSDRHMMAAAGAVAYAAKQRCREVIPGKAPFVEGEAGAKWVCVDAGSIVAHIFLEDARQRVDLESLWVEQLGASIQVVEQPETLNTMKTMRLDEDFDGAEEDNGR